MKFVALLLMVVPLGSAQVAFEAKWRRALKPDVHGTLSVLEGGIAFEPRKEGKQEIAWDFEDVQHLDRMSATEIAIQSYSDSALRLGRDRWYRFELVSGAFGDELHARVVERIGKPATDRVVRKPPDTELAVPAKHVGLLRGSQGMVYFSPEWIVYLTDVPRDSRAWRLDRDVAAVWSSDPYRLEVHVLGGSEAFVRRTEVHRFSLKRPLDPEYYFGLKMKLHALNRRH